VILVVNPEECPCLTSGLGASGSFIPDATGIRSAAKQIIRSAVTFILFFLSYCSLSTV
jgi:hypothetical protein